ncbi:MAG TPA: helix-turn-helix domain-containing protein [Gemmatimonadales bacterium]|jgi:sugar-specific transcriptional regulator TrmB|nr:helix-turn-helix domain-containing protein [Gemmatimonadales bacterium]
MTSIDLTPFGFTPTESLVYTSLLRLGPSTGYAVARACRLARANAYSALEGLVIRGAATSSGGRPAQYRPADPSGLVARVAASQGQALDRLARALEGAAVTAEPTIHSAEGLRGTVNALQQLVARAERSVKGTVGAELWRPSLPAWRRAAARATLSIRIAGDVGNAESLAQGSAPADAPTILLIDEARVFSASGAGDLIKAMWSAHPLLVQVGAAAVG